MRKAFVFPGQGAQEIGMGKALAEAFPEARYVFEEVDEALSQNLSRLMFEGPDSELILTQNAQPALMAVSIAVARVLEEQGNFKLGSMCDFVAGHSLGEYSALASADALSLTETAMLLRTRGSAMQRSVPIGEGAMAALIGLELDVVREVAKDAEEAMAEAKKGVCEAANDNAPGQVVISGNTAVVERAVAIASERGARRAVMLDVSSPFHCSLMQPAAEEMQDVLSRTNVKPPRVPVISNVTAQPESNPETINSLLVKQITQIVRWRECVEYMCSEGVDTLIELGTGKVLTGLAKRIHRTAKGMSVSSPNDVEEILKLL